MKSQRDGCYRNTSYMEWLWSLVNNTQPTKRLSSEVGLLWRNDRHQVAPELLQHNLAACPSSRLLLCFSFLLTCLPFLFNILNTLFSPFALCLPRYCLNFASPLPKGCFRLLVPSPPPMFRSLFLSPLLILCTCALSKEQQWVTLWEIPSPSSSLG